MCRQASADEEAETEAKAEIEFTPEMLKAGREKFYNWSVELDHPDEIIEAVYRAIEASRRASLSQRSQ